METGVILALHKNRPKGDFVVLRRVTGLDYPPVNIQREIDEALKTKAYLTAWFQPVTVPDVQSG